MSNRDFKHLKLLTLFTHSIIIFGMGHGIGFMILIDFIGVLQVFEKEFTLLFELSEKLEERIPLIFIFSIVGKTFLIMSFFRFKLIRKSVLVLIGIIFLWFSALFLTYDLNNSGTPKLSLITSSFFIIVSILLLFEQIKKYFTAQKNG